MRANTRIYVLFLTNKQKPPRFYVLFWPISPKLLHFAPKVPIFDKRKTLQINDLQRFVDFNLWFKWCHRDSNQGHKDFQSFALPTELWHHRLCLLNLSKRVQRYILFLFMQTFLQNIFHFLQNTARRTYSKRFIYSK